MVRTPCGSTIYNLYNLYQFFSEPISNRCTDGPGLKDLPAPLTAHLLPKSTSVSRATRTQVPPRGRICTLWTVAWLEVLGNNLLNERILSHRTGWPIADMVHWWLTKIMQGCLLDFQSVFNSNYKSKFFFMKRECYNLGNAWRLGKTC